MKDRLAVLHRQVVGKTDPYSIDVRESIEKYVEGIDTVRLPYLLLLKAGKYPVTMEEFVNSKYYLNKSAEVFPKVMDSLIELNNPDGDRLGMKYYEAVFTGGIGTAKTTRSLYTTAYQLYLLSCFRSPHILLNQDSASEIYFIFQSLNSGVAKDVDYTRFRKLIEVSPYFNEQFTYRKDLESRLVFPHNISVFPVSGETSATIGQNVYGGFIDEVNFMEVIEKSQKKIDGGTYNQAEELYNSIVSRRESRFMRKGVVPGILCLGSSKNYPGQFTDGKEEEAKTDGGIYYRDDVVWDIKPPEFFTGKWFYMFTGSESRKPYVIEDEDDLKVEIASNPTLVKKIPEEYKQKFYKNPYNSLREIAGVSTLAKYPYFPNVDALELCFDTSIKSIFTREDCDFDKTKVGIRKSRIIRPHCPRFAHVDLGLTSDAAGITIGHVPKFTMVGLDDDQIPMPVIHIDGTLRVIPPQQGEINFSKIRDIFYKLTELGMPIRWITFDSYQSVDSIQILKSKGYLTGNQSMDKTTLPYDTLKTALLDGRVKAPNDPYLRNEISHLERTDKGKIDHTPYSTKDVSDSFAGVVFGLTTQKMVWALHEIPPSPHLVTLLKEYDYEKAA